MWEKKTKHAAFDPFFAKQFENQTAIPKVRNIGNDCTAIFLVIKF